MKLSNFKVYVKTSFGLGIIDKKAKSFEDAFKRLSKSDKLRVESIANEDGQEWSKEELLLTANN